MAIKLLLAIFLCSILWVSAQQQTQARLHEARQCRLRELRASQPSQRIESEGGLTELWNEFEDQFQCAGVAAIRCTLKQNSLSLPNYSPSPRLVFIERGRGVLGFSLPGCAETYTGSQQSQGSSQEGQGQQGQRMRDQHQKVHRVRQGDIVAVPAGAAEWCYNDGNEELVAVSVTDLNNQANQLDQKLRLFNLAGGNLQQGQQQEQEQSSRTFQNIFRPFDENLMAEALNIPVEIVQKMQQEDNRGLIVQVKGGLSMIRPDEEQGRQGQQGGNANGLEETYCNLRMHQQLDNPREADVYSREAGRLNTVNEQKLPILRFIDMSAEIGRLNSNAMHAPHWTMNAHSVVYVTQGEARVQIVGPNGQTLLDDRVKRGDMFVVPQYFPMTAKAGNNGFQYLAIKTSSNPMKSPLVGKTSVFRAMPLQVITNSFQISNQEAQSLKYNRDFQTMLLPPRSTSS